jgi:hypothetical protein
MSYHRLIGLWETPCSVKARTLFENLIFEDVTICDILDISSRVRVIIKSSHSTTQAFLPVIVVNFPVFVVVDVGLIRQADTQALANLNAKSLFPHPELPGLL